MMDIGEMFGIKQVRSPGSETTCYFKTANYNHLGLVGLYLCKSSLVLLMLGKMDSYMDPNQELRQDIC